MQVCTIAFAFMAGEWPAYLVGNPDVNHTCESNETAYGPHALAKWVVHWKGCYKFDSGFLILWGARYSNWTSDPPSLLYCPLRPTV